MTEHIVLDKCWNPAAVGLVSHWLQHEGIVDYQLVPVVVEGSVLYHIAVVISARDRFCLTLRHHDLDQAIQQHRLSDVFDAVMIADADTVAMTL